MILAELRDYLAERKCAPLADMAWHFDADADALRAMLALLERKGRVRRLCTPATCGKTCNACSSESVELYEWLDA